MEHSWGILYCYHRLYSLWNTSFRGRSTCYRHWHRSSCPLDVGGGWTLGIHPHHRQPWQQPRCQHSQCHLCRQWWNYHENSEWYWWVTAKVHVHACAVVVLFQPCRARPVAVLWYIVVTSLSSAHMCMHAELWHGVLCTGRSQDYHFARLNKLLLCNDPRNGEVAKH